MVVVLIKPDGCARGIESKIVKRFKNRGFEIRRYREVELKDRLHLLGPHYIEHKGKPFYNQLISYMSEGHVIAMEFASEYLESKDEEIQIARVLAGDILTPGSIRGDYAQNLIRNTVHVSDSVEAASRERAIWFPGEF